MLMVDVRVERDRLCHALTQLHKVYTLLGRSVMLTHNRFENITSYGFKGISNGNLTFSVKVIFLGYKKKKNNILPLINFNLLHWG